MDVPGLALRDWKSCVGKLTVGSNPTLSASLSRLGAVRRCYQVGCHQGLQDDGSRVAADSSHGAKVMYRSRADC
jgi:hypothetical protein